MSIGNCDEMEDEETEVDEQRQFAEGLRNIHRHKVNSLNQDWKCIKFSEQTREFRLRRWSR